LLIALAAVDVSIVLDDVDEIPELTEEHVSFDSVFLRTLLLKGDDDDDVVPKN
jgi:hypothetical protein